MSRKPLGRLPNDPFAPRLRLGRFLTSLLPFPENEDWISEIPTWPMYLNDEIGDCTFATAGHTIQVFNWYGLGKVVKVTDADVLKGYSAVSGYDPQTGANDDGCVVQDVLNYWRKTGVGGHKIAAFAEVDLSNEDELRAAMNLFGTVYLGINFPNT